jgi:amidase
MMSRRVARGPLGVLSLLYVATTLAHQASGAAERVQQTPFDLDEATIAGLQQRLQTGQDTARSLVEKYLARIEVIDAQGPALHSIIEINPDARTVADQLDAERRARGPRGPLHGIPVLIKDNIATGDRMLTGAGSLALATSPSPKDAFIVRRLREAGAVILGKTNLSEWANFRSTHSTSGWSARGGQTRNPYALDRSPSGSSSGSGAAVAANLAAVAVGTETDGSIVAPSSDMALVGIKPTLGLLSRTGIVPIAHSQDTAGPIARTVADAAVLLGAMAGSDVEDDATRDSVRKGLRDYSASLDAGGLRGARIGVVRDKLFGYSRPADELAEQAIADMKSRGAIIVDPANIPTLGKFDETELTVLLYEFKADMKRYLEWLGPAAPVHSLADIIAFNEAHEPQELGYFGQELMVKANGKGPLESAEYRRALENNHRLSRARGIDDVMTRNHLDALVAPTTGPAGLIDLVTGDHSNPDELSPSTVAAVAGYPHITVPMGSYRGLPIGLSFFGRAWSEPTLIKIAYAYEQATKHRRSPTFPATVNPDSR